METVLDALADAILLTFEQVGEVTLATFLHFVEQKLSLRFHARARINRATDGALDVTDVLAKFGIVALVIPITTRHDECIRLQVALENLRLEIKSGAPHFEFLLLFARHRTLA